jgi:O-antigen ligase
MLILLSAVDGIARSPFVGHGAGSFAVLLGALGRQGLVDDVTMAHNLFLDVWFQFGIVPVLLLVFMATAFAVAAVRAARLTRDLGIASLLASATAMFGSAMFGTLFIRGIQEMFVLIIAMTAALVIQQRTKPAGAHA